MTGAGSAAALSGISGEKWSLKSDGTIRFYDNTGSNQVPPGAPIDYSSYPPTVVVDTSGTSA